MNLFTRRKFSFYALLAALLPAGYAFVGCGAAKTTLAALVTTLGNAVAAVYGVLGNSSLATIIKNDTAAAVAAINGWTPGSPAQDVIQALNLLIQNLGLIVPGIGPVAAGLVALAVSTVEEILADFGVTAPLTAAQLKIAAASGKYPSEGTLRSIHSSFRSVWKRKAASDAQLATIVVN